MPSRPLHLHAMTDADGRVLLVAPFPVRPPEGPLRAARLAGGVEALLSVDGGTWATLPRGTLDDLRRTPSVELACVPILRGPLRPMGTLRVDVR